MNLEEEARKQRELQAAIEERERRAAEESMRRRSGEPTATRTTSLAEEAFMNQDVLFAYDSFVLSSEAVALLEQKASWLQARQGVKVQIEGHCDERGTQAYNLALGERRAYAAKRHLTALGIDANRLSTISYGEERPLDPGRTEEAWARNRRAHFVITSQ